MLRPFPFQPEQQQDDRRVRILLLLLLFTIFHSISNAESLFLLVYSFAHSLITHRSVVHLWMFLFFFHTALGAMSSPSSSIAFRHEKERAKEKKNLDKVTLYNVVWSSSRLHVVYLFVSSLNSLKSSSCPVECNDFSSSLGKTKN